ncbi:phosphoenolpyruvate--protein phosphotransferase [Sphingomonas sp. NFR15]|uniref:phosphoenolpyruvate--protein phosphotransferase n=1 Tax=Sphingomonas sp. NFR15 TaxID=1566282 RepID=UPI000888A8CE|nr:phosphoenolpyruvate--protein phosphotransferase [Sphingomonas sp. NFR15]SDA22436.1 phosphocarrier protein [Sphingomonas sp. NFR15]
MTRLTLVAPVDGWLVPLADVADAVFADRLLGDGVAIDPLGDTLHAPAPGVIVSVHEAGHAVTLRLDAGPVVLMHVGLDTVRLGGAGFTPLVRAGERVDVGAPLLVVDLATVAAGAKSLVTPIVVTEGDHAITWRAPPGRVRRGDPLLALAADQPIGNAGGGADFTPSATRTMRVPLAHGLHARPCAKLAGLARGFDAEVRAIKGDREARLRSPSAMMTLAIAHGDTITIAASGADAHAAVDALADLIATGMDEGKPLASAAPVAPVPAVPTAPQREGVLTGVTASPGFATGIAAHLVRPEPILARTGEGIAAERARFADALAALAVALEAERGAAGPEQGAIVAAHRALLDDEDLIERTHARIDAGDSAAIAWRSVMSDQADALRAAADPHIAARADDLIDVEVQLQWRLAGQAPPDVALPADAILLADDLVPSQVASLDPARVAGIVTARGGPTSHVAIIAASRGIPALVAAGPRVLTIAAGTPLVLDTAAGTLTVDPDTDGWRHAQAEAAVRAARKAAARTAAMLEGRTLDGTRIEVSANLGKRAEAAPAVAGGAEGCGLLRTEFLFLDRAVAPDEDEQAADYAAIARALEGRPLVIRLLDIGGDKPAPYLPIAPEENPALGLRGIRVALAYPDILAAQMRAVLRASEAGDVRVMAPMIATVAELRAVRAAMQAESAALGLGADMPLGVMVETPAAAVMADGLAAECDFLSIGTNDLTQYVLAMDRGNPAVAGSVDGLDPAVLRMIDLCCRGAATHGKPVGVCGGLASDRLAVPILIGLGVTKLSAAPAAVAEVKALVRGVSLDRCRALAAAVLHVSTAAEVRSRASALLGELGL